MSAAWLNGGLVDAAAAISIRDRGFTCGDGLFETMRAYRGTVFRLRAHLARLADGARRIGLPLPDGLERAVLETVAASGAADAAVRLTISRGPADERLDVPAATRPTVLVTAHPYSPERRWYEAGVAAILASGRINEHAATAGLKQLGYLENILARAEARAAGADEALRLDTAGHLAEGTLSNVFVVVDGVLLTPPTTCGILPGITRATVLELAEQHGIDARVEPILPEILGEAREAFLTSSLREIVPLVRVGDRPIGEGVPGPMSLRLLAAYRRLATSGTRAA